MKVRYFTEKEVTMVKNYKDSVLQLQEIFKCRYNIELALEAFCDKLIEDRDRK